MIKWYMNTLTISCILGFSHKCEYVCVCVYALLLCHLSVWLWLLISQSPNQHGASSYLNTSHCLTSLSLRWLRLRTSVSFISLLSHPYLFMFYLPLFLSIISDVSFSSLILNSFFPKLLFSDFLFGAKCGLELCPSHWMIQTVLWWQMCLWFHCLQSKAHCLSGIWFGLNL